MDNGGDPVGSKLQPVQIIYLTFKLIFCMLKRFKISPNFAFFDGIEFYEQLFNKLYY